MPGLRIAVASVLVAAVTLIAPVRAQQEPPPGEPADVGNPPSDEPLSVAEIVERLRPSLVKVVTPSLTGNGVQLAAGVLTVGHLVRDVTQVELITSDGRRVPATVSRTDPSRDLALLTSELPLPSAELESLAAHQEGDEILVLGYPLGTQEPPIPTRGLISAIRMNNRGVDVVQTDAPSSAGGSGSPVIGRRGKVLGVLLSGDGAYAGLGFAVATETIDSFLAGAPVLTDSPLMLSPLPLPPLPVAAPGLYTRSPEEAAVQAADLGAGWTVVDRQPSAAGLNGKAVDITLGHPNGQQVRVVSIVFTTRELALNAWEGMAGRSLDTCEASTYSSIGDGLVHGACRVQNVAILMVGVSLDQTRVAFAAAASRINAAINPLELSRARALFHPGPPSVIAISAGELGPDWRLRETHQAELNVYSSGRLRLTFQQAGETIPRLASAEVEIFRDAATAELAWQQERQYGIGSAVSICDAGWTWAPFDRLMLECREANVLIRVFAPSMELARSAVSTMQGRIRAGLQ